MKIKRITLTAFLLCLIFAFSSIPAFAESGITAKLSTQKFYVDGELVNFTAYSINGNNYIRLRDIGKAVNFGVLYDARNNQVLIDSTAKYAPDNSKALTVTQTASAVISSQRILVNGNAVAMTAYSINGNNYVKLRDVASAVNFGVSYSSADNSVYILTGTDYQTESVSQQIISGDFAIRNVETGKNIRPYNAGTSDGNDIILYPHNEWKCLTWQFNHVEGATYQLQNVYTRKTFEPKSTLEAGVALWQQPLDDNSPQWEFIEQQDGLYAIRMKGTELYITTSSSKTDSPIILMPYENSSEQQWELIEQYPLF